MLARQQALAQQLLLHLVVGHGVELGPFLQSGREEDLDDFLWATQLHKHVGGLLVAIAGGVDDFLYGFGQGWG